MFSSSIVQLLFETETITGLELAEEAKQAGQPSSRDLFISCLCFPSRDTEITSTEHHILPAFKKKL